MRIRDETDAADAAGAQQPVYPVFPAFLAPRVPASAPFRYVDMDIMALEARTLLLGLILWHPKRFLMGPAIGSSSNLNGPGHKVCLICLPDGSKMDYG